MHRTVLISITIAAAGLFVAIDPADARGNGASARRGPGIETPSVLRSRTARRPSTRTAGALLSRPTRAAARPARPTTRAAAGRPARAVGNSFSSRPRNPAPRVIVVARRNNGRIIVNGLPYPVGDGPRDNSTFTLPDGRVNGWQFFDLIDSRATF